MPDFPSDAEKTRLVKIALRDRLITARQSMSAAVSRSAAVAVQAATTALVRRQRPLTTAAYVPIGLEPGGADLPEVLAGVLPPGGRLLLPLLRADADLDWAVYQGPGSLQPGPRGLREPAGDRLGVDAVREAQLVIVPALAVSRTGVRMGRGGGSYDRVLARIATARTVALLHDGELLDAVPAEPHDRRVAAVIAPATGLMVLPDPRPGPLEPPAGRNDLR